MSRSYGRILSSMVTAMTLPMSKYNKIKTRLFVSENLTQIIDVDGMLFLSTTARSTHDTNSLLTDSEPETIEWLDSLPAEDVLWDIGANVGAFSVYAGARRGLRVIAFEPGAASYAALQKNIELNHLSRRVDAYCVALARETKCDYLNMMNTDAGHSMHAFGTNLTVEGEISPIFAQSTIGFSADHLVQIMNIPAPDHIKLDVDSIELEVLRGAENLLRSVVKTVLVELYGSGPEDSIPEYLRSLGFEIDDGAHRVNGRNVLFRKLTSK